MVVELIFSGVEHQTFVTMKKLAFLNKFFLLRKELIVNSLP
jgi:hypothetical protein